MSNDNKGDNTRLSEELDSLLNGLFFNARKEREQYLTVEHILLGLIDAPSLATVWATFNVSTAELEALVSNHIDEEVPVFADDDEVEVQPTLGFQRTLQRAVFYGQTRNERLICPSHVLVALFGEKESAAVRMLLRFGVTQVNVGEFFGYKPRIYAKKLRKAEMSQELETSSKLSVKPAKPPPDLAFKKELSELTDRDIRTRSVASDSPKLFISYAHVDKPCLDRLLVHLKPLERAKLLSCWSDTQMRGGDKWRKEIEKAIESAAIAILLLSADFLASDFIVNNELPPLLVGAESRGVRILPVILKPCGFLRDRVLASFQAVNDPIKPLLGLEHIEQEAAYNRIADQVVEELRARGVKIP